MVEPESVRTSVLVVLGPGADAAVVAHTLDVLTHFGITFQEADWRNFPGLLAGASEPQVVVFATAFAYTDEHLALPEDVVIPVLRLLTDSVPPPAQVLTDTPYMATVGVGVPGAINAGLLAARILATNDAGLRDLLKTKPYRAS
jgi:phosphoribosylcarboxyaminoimidazole (NCAIR) mutase